MIAKMTDRAPILAKETTIQGNGNNKQQKQKDEEEVTTVSHLNEKETTGITRVGINGNGTMQESQGDHHQDQDGNKDPQHQTRDRINNDVDLTALNIGTTHHTHTDPDHRAQVDIR